MDKLIVEGGRPLDGSVRTAGSKNAVLPILAASILTREPLKIRRAPRLSDVRTMLGILRSLGARGELDENGRGVEISCEGDINPRAPWEEVRKMRGSVCVLGPLLARCGRAEVSLPGGCVFGVRPIDVHLKGLEALGAKVRIEHGYVIAEAPDGLRGRSIYLGSAFGSSVLGTANILMAATLAKGTTIIQGAACEPEVVDLADCLNAMGARISGQGSPIVTIEGVDELSGAEHEVIADRIEAGTYVIAGALCGGRVRVEGCRPDHLAVLLDRLWDARVPVDVGEDWIETQPYDPAETRPRSSDVTTHAYPGFPTDLQAQWMALMTRADGLSIITERIYPDRWMHLPELQRLGAELRRQGTAAVVRGTDRLSGAPVTASDLRASAALVLAGLVAEGTTEVHRVYHIDRGYERIEERLVAMGAGIRREQE